jgi:hypothetical protein
MFEPFLSCRVFGVGQAPSDIHLTLARKWSGLEGLNPEKDGSLQWESQAFVRVGGDLWFETPPLIKFPTHNAIIPLGEIDGARALAFVSPFPSVASNFKATASRYLPNGARLVEFVVRTGAIIEALSAAFPVRGVEGTNVDGFHAVLTAPSKSFPGGITGALPMKELHSVELDIKGQSTKIDGHCNIEMADVATEFHVVSSCLLVLFAALREQKLIQSRPSQVLAA